MKKLISFCVILCTLFLMGCQHSTSEIVPAQYELERTTVKIGEQSWNVEIAKTPEQRQQGLMFREELETGTGMLFVFEELNFHGFWMRNTLIPLDIIWIGEDMNVIEVHTLQPCTTDECPSFRPSQKALFVLEVSAGEFLGKQGDELLLFD